MEPTEDELRTCVEAAVRAPSIHNTQPWLFVPVPGGVEVHADLSRRLPAVDPRGRAMHISLGAAVLDLRVALRALGRAERTDLLPDPADPRHVATVRATGRRAATAEDLELFGAIARRASNREPFEEQRPPQSDLDALAAAAAAEGGLLRFLGPPERQVLLDLARTAEARRGREPAYRAELLAWTTDDPYRDDGIPLAAVGPWNARPTLPLRDFAPDREVPGRAPVPFEAEPTVATLAVSGEDGPARWLRAGQALQRVLLEATRRGLAASLFTQPLEDPELRGRLGPVQLALRVGYGRPMPLTPRRPVDEVIVHTHPVPFRPPHFS